MICIYSMVIALAIKTAAIVYIGCVFNSSVAIKSILYSGSIRWNYPAKIKNSIFPVNIFHLISKNGGLTIYARRRYVVKCWENILAFFVGKKNKFLTFQSLQNRHSPER
jgi:hypothetical protein